MNTAVIWNEESLKFLVLEGDYTRFDGVYVNSMDDGDIENELTRLIYGVDGDQFTHTPVDIQDFREAIVAGAELIECGFVL